MARPRPGAFIEGGVSMSPAAWILAWVTSIAVLLLERSSLLDLSVLGESAAPRTALCALPWLAHC